ncbi:MAG: hypothetical protein ACYSWP_07075 [Planctomycetota bacterium]|jgi:hypothetical protein
MEALIFGMGILLLLALVAGAFAGSAIEQYRWRRRVKSEKEVATRIAFSEGFNAGVIAERAKQPQTFTSTLEYRPLPEDLQ